MRSRFLIFQLIGDLALVNMGLGDKATALALSERAMATMPIEKDVLFAPRPVKILPRVAAQVGEPDGAIAALQKLLSMPGQGALAIRFLRKGAAYFGGSEATLMCSKPQISQTFRVLSLRGGFAS